MQFVKDFGSGLICYLEAIVFIIKHKLILYILIPLAFFAVFYAIGHNFEDASKELELAYASLNEDVNWFAKIWMKIKQMFTGVFAFLFLKAPVYLSFILLSPFLAVLSEKVEEKITSKIYVFDLKQLIVDVVKGIRIAIRNIIREWFFYMIWVIIASLIGLSEYNKYALLIIGFYYYGFNFMYYILERQRLSVMDSVKFVKKHSGMAFALGLVFSLLFIIPNGYGIIVAPMLAIVAATLGMHKLVDLSTSKFAQAKV